MLHGDLRADNMILTPRGGSSSWTGRKCASALRGWTWFSRSPASPCSPRRRRSPPYSPSTRSRQTPIQTGWIRPSQPRRVSSEVASTMPPIRGLPTLRRFQRDQASEALTLLATPHHHDSGNRTESRPHRTRLGSCSHHRTKHNARVGFPCRLLGDGNGVRHSRGTSPRRVRHLVRPVASRRRAMRPADVFAGGTTLTRIRRCPGEHASYRTATRPRLS
jgi:hypothetical protein